MLILGAILLARRPLIAVAYRFSSDDFSPFSGKGGFLGIYLAHFYSLHAEFLPCKITQWWGRPCQICRFHVWGDHVWLLFTISNRPSHLSPSQRPARSQFLILGIARRRLKALAQPLQQMLTTPNCARSNSKIWGLFVSPFFCRIEKKSDYPIDLSRGYTNVADIEGFFKKVTRVLLRLLGDIILAPKLPHISY